MQNNGRRFRLGTRGSRLARWQAEWVAARLGELGVDVELVFISTQGDVKTGSIGSIGGQGVFTKEIQRALLDDEVDFAVHSLKDLPTLPVDGLQLAAVPPRESVCDVLATSAAADFASLPAGARVGTGSMRRCAQLLHARSDLEVLDIRGNVETRLQKLDDGQYDAIVLAEAGLKRLGLTDRITQVLPVEIMLPAVGQGALGIEIRGDDQAAAAALAALDDPVSHAAVIAERSMLAALQGGCLAPIAAWGRSIDDDRLQLDGVVLSKDGSHRLSASQTGPHTEAEQIGIRVAELLLRQGAANLVAASREPQSE